MPDVPPKLDESLLAAEPAAPAGALWIILFIVFIDLMGFGIILPQLPFYALRYHVSAFQVALLFSIYSACQFLAAPVLGLISDRYGRRPVLILSQLGSAFGYALLALTTYLHLASAVVAMLLLYTARIIDGLSGGNISTAQAYISDVTTPQTRARGMGLMGAAFGIGFAFGPFLGGIIGNDTNRAAFPAVAAAMFSLTAMVLSWLWLPESRTHKPANEEVWLHPSKFAPILRNRLLTQLLAISFFSMAAFTMMEGVLALYLNQKFTFGPDHMPYGSRQVGEFFGFIGFFIIVVQGGLVGRLSKMFGEWPVSVCGSFLVAVAMGVYFLTGQHPILWLLLVAGALNATGRSLQGPTLSTLVSKYSDRSQQGTVYGLFHGIGSLARVAGPALAGAAFSRISQTAPFVISAAVLLGVALWQLQLAMSSPPPVQAELPPVVDPEASTEFV